jgi:hypothetical protein
MARYRWADGPQHFAGVTPRPVAFLRSPIVDDAGRPRARDQRQPALLARIRQDGVSGDWQGEDGEGTPCIVQQGSNGLEIYATGEAEGDQADPDIVGTAPPGANLDGLRRRFGAAAAQDTLTSTEQAGRMKAWQSYLDKLWAPRS